MKTALIFLMGLAVNCASMPTTDDKDSAEMMRFFKEFQISVSSMMSSFRVTNERIARLESSHASQVATLTDAIQQLTSALNTKQQHVDALQKSNGDLARQLQTANDELNIANAKIRQSESSVPTTAKEVVRCSPELPDKPDAYPEVHVTDKYGRTPLSRAALNGSFDEVCALLKKGADPRAKDDDGQTILDLAVKNNPNIEVISLLLQEGADINAKNERLGWTPLHHALFFDSNIDVILLLLQKGADLHAKDRAGATPIHYAVGHSDVNVINQLLDKGADVNAKDDSERTPLHKVAAINRDIEFTRLLLQKGADPNSKGSNGSTPLHESVKNINIEVMRLLLQKGANPNVKDMYGKTPLSLASKSQYDRKISLLKEHGARE